MKTTTKLNVKQGWLPIKINEKIINAAFLNANKTYRRVLAIVPSTKPCFYKLFSIWKEAERKKLPYIVLHSGQHYDNMVSSGIREFGYDKFFAVDLQIRGDLSQKSSELFLKLKYLFLFLQKKWPQTNLVPMVSGDTLTAGITPIAWVLATNQKSIQIEAGLRAMSPTSFLNINKDKNINPEKFIDDQFKKNWILNRTEPFPEQLDTFISAAGCQYFFAPCKINREHLIREAYNKKDIFNVGNTVVDVLGLKQRKKNKLSIFELYPKLKNGEWLRMDIHHRGNLTEKRIKNIVNAIIDLVNNDKKIVLVELNSTKTALQKFKLREKFVELSKKNKNFLFTPLWKKYTHVIEFIKSPHCWAILSDSGSMQEEMNELQKPCLTLRFNTDRPETVMFAHSNILIPPISKEFIVRMVNYIYNNKALREKMSHCKKLYGKNVAGKIVSKIDKLFKNHSSLFRWGDEELKAYKGKS